jgi:hypothetical protein
MEIGVILLTLGAYGLAIYQGLRERTALYAVALLAGQISTLPSPLWQLLYQFQYQSFLTPLYIVFEHPLPRAIFLAGWTALLPPLLVVVLTQRQRWAASYAAALLLFTLFLIYHLVIEAIGIRSVWWNYRSPSLPLGLSSDLLAAIMNALVSLGALAALQMTRRHTLFSLLIFVLPIPLLLRLLVHGLLGAPIFTVLLIRSFLPELSPESWADTIGTLGTIILLGWAVHLVAVTLARQGEQDVLV